MARLLEEDGQRFQIMPPHTFTTAEALTPVTASTAANVPGAKYVTAIGKFTYGSGGTTVKVYIQTSLDGGVTWIDIICFAFALATLTKVVAVSAHVASAAPSTPTDGTLADNTKNDGLIGDRFRAKYVSTGTYAGGTALEVEIIVKG